MAKQDAGLLAEIEADVLASRSLADALRKCVILGGKAGSVELRDWATHELRGYKDDDEVPDYRTVGAVILADAIVGNGHVTGQRIGVSELPDFTHDDIHETFTFRQGVGQIEALIKSAESGEHPGAVHLSLPMAAELGRIMDSKSSNHPFQRIMSLYWSVSAAALHGIIDQVRTTLTELVAEMRAGMPAAQDLPSAEVANQAVNVAVHGDRARVVITSAQSSATGTGAQAISSTAPTSSWWSRWHKVGTFIVGAAAVLTMILTYLLWLR